MKTLERQLEYDIAYMKMTYPLKDLSYATRSKVGCIIVSPNGQIVSQGYNGMPCNMPNECEFKDKDGNLKTKIEVLHAESNAISKCAKFSSSTDNATIYVSLSPCIECSKLIIQSGIKRVVFGDWYRTKDGLMILLNAGVKVDYLDVLHRKLEHITRDTPELYTTNSFSL